ncbi:hypothetical protein [Actinomadura harenae]|uniref:hypothetical protein n=1 Tax=Actinomadura harenae TaxID=2483351 RepID=UPI0011C3E61F|nr:hypothetical protein [Actinomadura harenae]
MGADEVASRWDPGERGRWGTWPGERLVLAVGRTYTSAVRLLDALAVFRGDPRVDVLFAFDDGTAFFDGAEELVRAAGWRRVPWADAGDLACDLVLTASENVDLSRFRADVPVVVLPHGIGFHKIVPDTAGGTRVSGVVPDRYLRGRDVSLVTSHDAQAEALQDAHPDAADRCVTVGDAAFDRMRASLPLREYYRAALGVAEGRRLLVVTSTWAADSLLGRVPDLPARLLGALPADEYAVAVVTHPNIASRHGPAKVGQVLADASDAGLVRIPPRAGWQASLVASDLVVGDHGSVTLYGAALDRPVLLGPPGPTTAVPGTPPDELSRRAPRLDVRLPLLPQIEKALAGGPVSGIAADVFDHRGQAAEALRALLYSRLGLDPPEFPAAVRAFEDPVPEPVVRPRSFHVHTRPTAPGRIALWRFPIGVPQGPPPVPDAFHHRSVAEDERDRASFWNASVLVRRLPGDASWVRGRLADDARLLAATVTAEGGCMVGHRDGRLLHVAGTDDPTLAAAAVYTCVRAGAPLEGRFVLPTGEVTVTLR